MHTGLLWLLKDSDKSPLPNKIQAAVDCYTKKYGRRPTMILANPAMEEVFLDGITIRPYRSILPHHIWIGVEEVKVEEKQEAEEG
jgi:hypothetical protein